MVPMTARLTQQWWAKRKVQQKVWTILLAVFVPLVLSIVGQVALITHLRTLQEQQHHIILAREQLQIIRRLAVDLEDEARISQLAFWALLAAVGGGIALGLIGAKLLAGSITGPLASLHASVTTLGTQAESGALLQGMAIHSSDEIGRLAAAYHEMAD